MKLTLLAILAIGAVALAGCASSPKLSAEQCTGLDWYQLGVADGQKGANVTAVNTPVKLCKENGITADLDSYNRGRDEGLKTYCKPATLLDATIQGVGDPFSCDPMSTQQRAALDKGVETQKAVARYQQVKAQYDQLAEQKKQINAEGVRLTNLYQQTSDETQRNQIQQRIGQLRQQLTQIDEQIKKADPIMATEEQTYQTAVKSYESYKASISN